MGGGPVRRSTVPGRGRVEHWVAEWVPDMKRVLKDPLVAAFLLWLAIAALWVGWMVEEPHWLEVFR